jgi:ABC-type nitrate/sulfonate/bicarbonate transport system permease component
MGIPHTVRLILPKIIALAIALPLLILWTSGIALVGGAVAASHTLGITVHTFLTSLPVVVPGIIVGLALLNHMVLVFNLPVISSLIVGHASLLVPYTVRVVSSSLANLRHDIEDAAVTLGATRWQALWMLRLPAALPFLFPALRVGIAAGLVGAMVAELPTGAQAGLGARLLTGSYYGQTVQIWSALVMSAFVGLALTASMGALEALVLGKRRQV